MLIFSMSKKYFFLATALLILLVAIAVSTVKQSTNISIKPVKNPLIEDKAIILPINDNDPIYGNPGAPVTVSEFFSFECKECKQRHEEVITFIDKNPGKVRLINKAITQEDWLGNKKVFSLLALKCAQDQGQYWSFLNQAIKLDKLDENTIKNLFPTVNLNSGAFSDCLKNTIYENAIKEEQTNLKILGFDKTPIFYINNRKINPTDDIKLDDILKKIVEE